MLSPVVFSVDRFTTGLDSGGVTAVTFGGEMLTAVGDTLEAALDSLVLHGTLGAVCLLLSWFDTIVRITTGRIGVTGAAAGVS